MGGAIICLVLGVLGILFSSVTTIHKTTAGAMGRTALNIVVRIISIGLLILGAVLLLGATL